MVYSEQQLTDCYLRIYDQWLAQIQGFFFSSSSSCSLTLSHDIFTYMIYPLHEKGNIHMHVFGIQWEPSWVIGCFLFTVSSLIGKGKNALWFLFLRTLILFMKPHPHSLNTLKGPHFQIPSDWTLALSIWISGIDINI